MSFNNEFYAKLNESIYKELVQVQDIQYITENESAFMLLRCVDGSSEYSLRYCLDSILNKEIPATEFSKTIDSIVAGLDAEISEVADSDVTSYIDDFERIKYRLAFTVASKSNIESLQGVPHLEYLDMYVYFYVLITKSKDKIVRLDVSDTLLSIWGVDVNKVMYYAVQNIGRLLPLNFSVMHSDTEFESEFLSLGISPMSQANIYILSNQYMVHGASALLYPDALKSIAERLDDDLIVVPISIHMCLILESRYYEDSSIYKQLSDLIDTVKFLESRDEYISDNLYFYSRATNKLIIKRRPDEKENY